MNTTNLEYLPQSFQIILLSKVMNLLVQQCHLGGIYPNALTETEIPEQLPYWSSVLLAFTGLCGAGSRYVRAGLRYIAVDVTVILVWFQFSMIGSGTGKINKLELCASNFQF